MFASLTGLRAPRTIGTERGKIFKLNGSNIIRMECLLAALLRALYSASLFFTSCFNLVPEFNEGESCDSAASQLRAGAFPLQPWSTIEKVRKKEKNFLRYYPIFIANLNVLWVFCRWPRKALLECFYNLKLA